MIPPLMRSVATAYGRAVRSQLTGKMLLLSMVPFLMSLALWGAVLFFGLQPLMDVIFSYFTEHGFSSSSNSVLATFGLSVLKTFVPLMIAMILLLPVMLLTSLLFMGVAAMPAIARHVGQRQFPALERKEGGSLVGSVTNNLKVLLLFVPLWLASLVLYIIPPLAVAAQAALWGWLTARVMAYDALADYASAEERETLLDSHRRGLFAIGLVSGLAGAFPGVVWIGGGALSMLLPFLAGLSIWLYLVIFIFSGLWFEYYCLQALQDLRASRTAA